MRGLILTYGTLECGNNKQQVWSGRGYGFLEGVDFKLRHFLVYVQQMTKTMGECKIAADAMGQPDATRMSET